MLRTAKRMVNDELDRVAAALGQTRKDHEHAEQLVTRREELSQRLDHVLKAITQS